MDAFRYKNALKSDYSTHYKHVNTFPEVNSRVNTILRVEKALKIICENLIPLLTGKSTPPTSIVRGIEEVLF